MGSPRFARAAHDAEPGLLEAVRSICGEVAELSGARDCDLAVLSDPDAGSVARAAQAVRPGGACYGEWTVPAPGALRRARRRLEAAGFEDVQGFWAWPPPTRAPPAFWLPLDAGHALRHFLATRPSRSTLTGRAADAAQRAAWRLARRADVLVPVCFVARKPSGAGGPRAEGALTAALRERWTDWGLGPPPARLATLILTGGPRTINKVILLVFADEAPRPALAAKLARVPATEPVIEREATVLASLPAAVRRSGVRTPDLVFHERLAGFAAMGQRAIEGESLDRALDGGNHRRIALAITDFLIALGGHGLPSDGWRGRLVEPAISRFEESFGAFVDRSRLAAARAVLSTLPDLAPAFEHRDCTPENILLARDGTLSVLDWEFAEPHGLPFADLVYFSFRTAMAVEGTMGTGAERATYARLLDPASATGAVFAECVARYLAGTGMASEAVAPLRLLTWTRCATWQLDLMVRDAGGGSVPPAVQRLLEPGGSRPVELGAAAAMLAFLDAWLEEVDRAAQGSAA